MSDDDDSMVIKVVLIGESGVGKTSIITRYINNQFDKDCPSNVAASFISKQIYVRECKKKVKLDIWDTAGQEKYRSMAKIFYKDAAIVILVYDITKVKTFEEIKNYWYDQVKNKGEEVAVFGLAANKCDLYEREQVTETDAKRYANKIGAIFKQTSALSSDGIDDLFYHCAQKVINPKYDYNAQETQAKMTYEHNQNKKGTKLSANEPAPKKDCNC
jgi:small GTP-binding protein